jgi:hypothetical protein
MGDRIEKQNAIALRAGLVNFIGVKGFEAYVTDGSYLQSIQLKVNTLES